MYFVGIYDYSSKDCFILKKGSKYQMMSYIEGHLIDYINNNQTYKIKSIDEILKKSNQSLTKEEWDNNFRFYITKSNNNSKYTMKKVLKDKGYFYNSYNDHKLFSIYLIKKKSKNKTNYKKFWDAVSYITDEEITVHPKANKIVKPVYLDELKEYFENRSNRFIEDYIQDCELND